MIRFHAYVVSLLVTIMVISPSAQAENAMDAYRRLRDTDFAEALPSGSSTSSAEELSTLDEYLAYAGAHNPELKASFYTWKAALESVARVHSLPDPQISYAYYIRNVETRVGPQRHRLEVTQMFPWFGTLDQRSAVNIEDARIKWERFQEQRLALEYEVKIAYYQLYLLDRRLVILRDSLSLLSSLEGAARSAYSAGVIEHGGLLRMQVEFSRLEERLLNMEDLREPLAARLNALLHRPPDAVSVIADSLDTPDVVMDKDMLRELVTARSPQLATYMHVRRKAEEERTLADKESMPSFGIGIGYIETGESDISGVADNGKDPLTAMFTVTLPIWRGTYEARRRQAELQAQAADEQRASTENQLVAELEMALYHYRDAERKLDLYTNALLPRANQALSVTRTSFVAGNGGYLDLIDAQQALLELQLSALEATVDRVTALAGIERLAGGALDYGEFDAFSEEVEE